MRIDDWLPRYLYACAMVALLALALSGLFFGFTCERRFNYEGLLIGPTVFLPLTYKFVVPFIMLVALLFVRAVSPDCWSTTRGRLQLVLIPFGIYAAFSTLLLLHSLAKPQADCF